MDTSLASKNGHALELDFRNVTKELKFVFSSSKHSVQRINPDLLTSGTFKLTHTESEVVKLDLSGATQGTFKLSLKEPDTTTQKPTADIKVVTNAKTTAYNIERAIEKAITAFSQSAAPMIP